MKVIALSDLHGDLIPIKEECDLICICGDIVPLQIQSGSRKTKHWLRNKFKPWCESLPCDKVLFISGNHDLHTQDLEFMYSVFPKDDKVTYLFHEEYIYNHNNREYHIFGTPYCKIFGDWAFMDTDERLRSLYNQIPEGLDILLTHDQPFGWGDTLEQKLYWNDTEEHIGNKPLVEAILSKQPEYLFCGHLHSTTHECIKIGKTKRYNVSIKDEMYNIAYPPLCISI